MRAIWQFLPISRKRSTSAIWALVGLLALCAAGSLSAQVAEAEKLTSQGFLIPIKAKSLETDPIDQADILIKTTSPSAETQIARLETLEDGRLRGLFPYPTSISQASAPFHFQADAFVYWVKRTKEDEKHPASVDELFYGVEELELYAEGNVWISFGKGPGKFTARASRAFLTISNSKPDEKGFVTTTLRGMFDDVAGHTGRAQEPEKSTTDEGINLAGQTNDALPGGIEKDASVRGIKINKEDERIFALERGERIFLKASRMRVRDISNRKGLHTDVDLEDPIASRSSLAIPSFSFRAKEMRVQLSPTRNIASLQDPSVWARSTRLFTYPSENYSQDLDSRFPVQRFSVSSSDVFGASFRTKVNVIDAYDYLFDPEPTFRPFALSPEFDYFSRRGVGYGLQGEYDRLKPFESGFRTWLHGYYIEDDGDDRQTARDLGFYPLRRPERGRVRGYAQARIDGGYQIDAHINYQSDRTFIQEFYEEEFNRNDQERTFLQISRQWHGRAFYALTDVRARDFIDEVESVPVLGFVSHRENVGPHGLGLQLSTQAEMGIYRLRLDDSNQVHNDKEILRARAQAMLHRPIDFGALLFEPFVGVRMLAADHRFVAGATPNQPFDGSRGFAPPAADGSIDEDFITKPQVLFGANLQTNFSRVYSGVQSKFLALDGLRHTISPSVRWQSVAGATRRELDFVQMDRYDAEGNSNRVYLSLRNRLQTRRKVGDSIGNVDFADLLLEIPLYPNADRDNHGERFGPLEVQGRFRPHPQLSFDAGAFFEAQHFDWTRWYLAMSTVAAKTSVTLYYRALRAEHAILGVATETRFNSTYSIGIEYDYDFRAGKSRDFALRISRTFFETFSFHFKVRRDAIRDDLNFSLSLSANFGPANYQPGQ